ncbi:MINDY deubiquitinase domain [Arabidopsis thaliana x Arabidopsis arenosa]|uniref:MINDY deubiquitinase domain n=1 Tax=Arabidopsis thaliana x Arabidopsis arenosa TaxID=1240361 RepID=A0A8T1Y3W0_9BRAS|nr:MINDY deubiquitinase domain [Arabidopsis thaliana x Arabidopsis arenosa]
MAIDDYSRPPPDEIFYKTKKIKYRGQTRSIILQDDNGPCPLIAICNVLILRHGINLDTHNSQVSEEKLLNLVGEKLSDEDEYIDVELIKRLAAGIIFDLKFDSITDFELTPELAIFASLKIPLYHGWLVDPQDLEIVAAIGGRSHDDLKIALTALDTQTVKAQNGQSSVDFAASITASAEHCGLGKGDIEETELLLKALTLSEMEASLKGSFDTDRGSIEGEVVPGSEDDTLVTSVDAAAGCTITLGSNIGQQSDDQFYCTESEDRTDCDVGNKINLGEEVSSTTSITKSSEAQDHDQLSSMGLGDETVGDAETENSSKMTDVHVTSSEAPISVEKTNLESTKNDIISEDPLKSEATTFVNADLSDKSQDDDGSLYESEGCVSLGSSVYEVESLLGQSSPEGKGTNGLTQEEGKVIKEFFKDSASQLTWHGLCTLEDNLEEWELCVLFRNNHFSTMLKRNEKLYTLVTDQGYQKKQDLVWERFNQINGDSAFFTGNFTEFNGKSRKWDQQHGISKTENSISGINSEDKDNTDSDLQLAIELSLRNGIRGTNNKLQAHIFFITRTERIPNMAY